MILLLISKLNVAITLLLVLFNNMNYGQITIINNDINDK